MTCNQGTTGGWGCWAADCTARCKREHETIGGATGGTTAWRRGDAAASGGVAARRRGGAVARRRGGAAARWRGGAGRPGGARAWLSLLLHMSLMSTSVFFRLMLRACSEKRSGSCLYLVSVGVRGWVGAGDGVGVGVQCWGYGWGWGQARVRVGLRVRAQASGWNLRFEFRSGPCSHLGCCSSG